jgi:hypothetical protein
MMRTFITGFIAASLLTLSLPTQANPYGHRHHMRHYHHHHPHYVHRGWVAPAVVGGIIAGAAIHHYANPAVVYVETVPVQRPAPICTEWREIRTEDGRIIQERTCTQQ